VSGIPVDSRARPPSRSRRKVSRGVRVLSLVNRRHAGLLLLGAWAGLPIQRSFARPAPGSLGPSALAKLATAAEAAMRGPLRSVIDKTHPAASGDPHDYTSMGPYWWPDPDKADGLPYLRRDGQVNPETRGNRSDSPAMKEMASHVEILAASWHHTRQPDHARKAGDLLRHWFLEPGTRMNPHLQYAQAIPGICDGRAIGIIDGVALLAIPSALRQLQNAPGWSAAEETAIQTWFSHYLDWLDQSPRGREIDRAANNHATWYDVQRVTHARFTGREDLARKVLSQVAARRIDRQFHADGSQPHEIARTLSWGYSLMNLRGMFLLARHAETSGTDLWNHQGPGGRGLQAALLYLARFCHTATPWPHPSLRPPNPDDLLPLLAEALRIFPPETFPPDLVRRAAEAKAAEWRDFS
jgi:hypothetical protein